MSVLKRPFGRRVTGVGVGVALLVLGLAAPALAVPTVTGLTPTSGPDDCVVVITGTGFLDFPQIQQSLTFDGPGGNDVLVAQADWFALSATEIWAVVPDLTEGNSYTILFDDPSTSGVTGGTFLSTAGAGGCAPTIASFTPICGSAGATVVITGTNLIGPDLVGAEVRFNPYGNTAATGLATQHTVPDVDEPTSLSVIVPSGAADGPIRVDTFASATGGRAFSTASFQVPPPDCGPVTGEEHARGVTLALKKHLRARGVVSLTDAEDTTTECVAGVTVKIQRRKGGSWKGVGTATTDDAGAYKVKIKDKPGTYRAKAKKVTLEDGAICLAAVSSKVKHSH